MQEYEYSCTELAKLAAKEKPLQQVMEVGDPQFLSPKNMIEETQQCCFETEQPIPISPGTTAHCVYGNPTLCYAQELTKVKHLTGARLEKLHIVGSGSSNRLLNQLIADCARVIIEAGPSEATTIESIAT